MLIKFHIRSQLCLGLILLSLETTAVAQSEPYACGVDDQAAAEPDDVTLVVTGLVSEAADDVAAVRRPRIGSRSLQIKNENESAENTLLRSAEAVRKKLRSERSKLPEARYRMTSSRPVSDEVPAVLDARIRNEKHWRLLPKVKPFDQLLSRGKEKDDEQTTIRQTSHTEPAEQQSVAKRRSTLPSRHLTSEELAEYVKEQRSRPWWLRGR